MLDTLDETTTQLDSKESLKRDPSIPSLYRHYVPTLHGNGNGYLGKCPRHADDTPSFSVYKDQDGSGVWCYKCWGCNSAGDIFHFLKWLNDTSFVEAKKEVMTFLGRDQKYDAAKEKINNTLSAPKPVEKPSRKYDKAATIARLHEAEPELRSHGVSLDVARALDVGVDTIYGVGPCITFPYDDQNIKLRSLNKKAFLHYKGTSTAGLFYNFATLEDDPDTIFITESERDSLTMISHGFHAISVSSATACINSDGSLKFASEDLDKLRQIMEIYLALDQDEEGKECARALQRALPHAKILTWEYHGEESGDAKDIGEIYQSDPGRFIERIGELCAVAASLSDSVENPVELGEEPGLGPEPEPAIEPEVQHGVGPLPHTEVAVFPLTDAGNGERLVAEHGNNIRYLNDKRVWRIWDGVRWNTDTVAEISRLAKDTVRRIALNALSTDSNGYLIKDVDTRKKLTDWSFGCESRSRLENMVALAAREESVSTNSSSFDQNPWLFNCGNGTLDLETNSFRSARREDLLSKRSPVMYDPKAICPRFETFLAEILPSPETRRFLQSSLGYTLSGHGWEEFVWFLIGEKGANGKTTLLETVRHVFGEDDYSLSMNFNSLLKREGQGPSPDLARLRGVRFASACESDQGQRLSTAVLKRLTSADRMTAAFKYENETEFTQTHKLWVATNFPPEISSADDAMWRRIARIPFNYSVPPEKQDAKLLEKLKAEGPGILNWLFAGWKMYQEDDGLELPEEVRGATELYREVLDVVKDFLKECVVGDGDIGSTKLYLAFKSWFMMSHNMRQQPMSQRMFSTRLERLGYRIEKRRDGNFICGVGRLAGEPDYGTGQLDDEPPFGAQ